MLNIASASYLVSILGRQQVAQIRGSPIYVVTSVALIPLSSKSNAEKAIEQTKKEAQSGKNDQPAETASNDSHSSADEGSYHSDGQLTDDHPEEPKALTPPNGNTRPKSREENDSVAQDVMGKKGQYGRFAERWFSRKGWTTERRRAQGMSADDTGKIEATRKGQGNDLYQLEDSTEGVGEDTPKITAQQLPQPSASQGHNVMSTLLPKLLKTTKMLFASRSFFYSYDYDITRRFGAQPVKTPNVPLYRSVDPLVRHYPRSL